MRTAIVVWILLLVCGLCAWSTAGEPQCCPAGCQCGGTPDGCNPRGGLFPYGGGLLTWWPHGCFPCCGAPDDYCRKPLPCVCWPPYADFYTLGPPETCCMEK
jgi:hypothetical protein